MYLPAEASICPDCDKPVGTDDDYVELVVHAIDDPTLKMTLVYHAGCKVLRVVKPDAVQDG